MATKIDLCEQCKATGLPMHIALLLPVPAGVRPALPAWANVAGVTGVSMPGYSYALRTLRAGYLYAFFKKNSRGSNRWQAWDVSANGQMYPMADPAWVIPIANMTCRRDGHAAGRLHHIVIEDPHLSKTAWIAFSEHRWSSETLQRYAADEALRDARMLRFEPAQLIASDSAHSQCITPASVAALEAICDYSPSFDAAKLPYGEQQGPVRPVSTDEAGGFNADALATHSTRYPWADGRKGSAAPYLDLLHKRGLKQDGTPHPGVVVALPDAIGCAHEMNGYRNDVAGRIEQYGIDRAVQVMAYNAIFGIQKALENQAAQVARDASETGVFRWSTEASAQRMKSVGAQYANDPARVQREQDLCARWERDARQKMPSHIANQRQYYLALSDAEWLKGQAQVDQQASKYTTPTQSTGKSVVEQREARSQQWEKSAVAQATQDWTEKYKPKINWTAHKAFKDKWDAFLAAADDLIDRRTVELIKWLEAPLFLTALDDFDPRNFDDGMSFEDKIGTAIVGMASSKIGRGKVDAWVKAMEVTRTNLLWRAIALNQKEGVEEVNAALAHAKSGLDLPLTTQNWAHVAVGVKWNKLADLYKKAQSWSNTNIKAALPGSGMKAMPLGGLDKLLVSVGDRVCKGFFAQKVDSFISEKVVQSIFLMRAGAHVDDVLDLVKTQAEIEKLDRFETLRRLRGAQAFASVLDDGTGKLRPNAQVLTEKWNKLAKNASQADSSGKFNAAKDARLAFVIAILEAFNLAKSGYDVGVKQDGKSLVVLTSAVLSMGSAATDVYTNVVKGTLEESSYTFQRFKFVGGVLSGVASVASSVGSLMSMKSAIEREQYGIAALNFSNFAFTIVGAGFNALATLTYCGSYLGHLAERQSARGLAARAIATRVLSQAATRWLMYRSVFMAVGMTLNILSLGIQLAIWRFSDDDLQEWIEKCAFGCRRDKRWDEKRQAEELFKATYAVGLSS